MKCLFLATSNLVKYCLSPRHILYSWICPWAPLHVAYSLIFWRPSTPLYKIECFFMNTTTQPQRKNCRNFIPPTQAYTLWRYSWHCGFVNVVRIKPSCVYQTYTNYLVQASWLKIDSRSPKHYWRSTAINSKQAKSHGDQRRYQEFPRAWVGGG